MEIKELALTKIKPSPYNPRLDLEPGDPGYERIRRSIEQFDLVEPLVWNKRSGNLIGGHQRYKIIKARGDERVQVVVVDLDDNEERTLNLALNKAVGDWDTVRLAELLKEMQDVVLDDDATPLVELGGFDQDEFDTIIADADRIVGEILKGESDPDEIPEPPDEPITKTGDLWVLGNHRLLCGSSTITADVEKLLEGAKIEAVLTDPPYCSGGFQEAGKSGGSKGTTAKSNRRIANDTLSTRGYQALLRTAFSLIDGDLVYVFTDWRMWISLFDVLESTGYGVRNMIVWDKGTPGMGKGWRQQHELIMFGTKISSRFDKHKAAVGNVLQANRTGNVHHATEKPVDLLLQILGVTDFAKIICDPFLGSGSTLIACETTGQHCYGFEIEPRYCDVVVERWEK